MCFTALKTQLTDSCVKLMTSAPRQVNTISNSDFRGTKRGECDAVEPLINQVNVGQLKGSCGSLGDINRWTSLAFPKCRRPTTRNRHLQQTQPTTRAVAGTFNLVFIFLRLVQVHGGCVSVQGVDGVGVGEQLRQERLKDVGEVWREWEEGQVNIGGRAEKKKSTTNISMF